MKQAIKKIFLSLSIISLYSISVMAQGTVHESAMLDLSEGNGGLLVPQITLIENEGAIEAPSITASPLADGLIIYHNGANNLPKGFWYWDADISEWILYSDFTSIYVEQNLDDFCEVWESNDFGMGTAYDLEDDYHTPWASATPGIMGDAFSFQDSVEIINELGDPMRADRILVSWPHAIYSVEISATVAASASSTTITGQLFVNDAPVGTIFFRHSFQLKDRPTSINTSGNVELNNGDIVDFRFISDVKNKGVEVEGLNIRFSKLGEL